MNKILKFDSTINALRGLSVLSVLFFHLEFQIFKGGFIGVDVFFVISGYLISKSVIPKIQNNQFSFTEYLNRRLRRILPSYVLIIFVSFLFISFFFSNEHFYYSIKEIFYSFFFFQNFYYWDQSGYFGLENLYKPLLNTWSLSLEFQFYILFPLIFWIFKKFIILPILLSLILSIIFLDRNFSYFLFFTRFFEFGFGIIIFYLKQNEKKKLIKNNNYFFLFGLSLILVSILYLDGNKSFPGFYAIGPCLGASLIIYVSNTSTYNSIIDNKILNFFGTISYSLYLIHWPLIIFYKYYSIKINLNFIDQLILIILSTILAYINTYYFENFFYKYKKKNIFFSLNKILIFNFVFFITISLIVFNNDFPEKYLLNKSENVDRKFENNLRIDKDFSLNGKKKILIIGNSHGLDLYKSINTISYYLKNLEIRYFQMGDECYGLFTGNLNYFEKIEFFISKFTNYGTQKNCLNQVLKLKNSNLIDYANTIIISNRYRQSSLRNLAKFIKTIKKDYNKVVLSNNGPKFIEPNTLINRHKKYNINEINKLFYESQDFKVVSLNKKLLKIANEQNSILLDKYSLICNIKKKSCEVLSIKKELFFLDYDHFSKVGHQNFGKKILENKLYQLF